jgi:hypothetical protein
MLWATVRHYEGVTNPDEAAKRVREGFVPLISEHQGFVAYYWMDAGDGVMFSTSFFEDQADEEDSNPPGRRLGQGEYRGSVAEPTGDHGGPCGGSALADHPQRGSLRHRPRSISLWP